MKNTTARIPAGFMELLPQDQIAFEGLRKIIAETYEEFGFVPQDTPMMEFSEVLLSKSGGDTEKQIYTLEKGDDKYALRFDLTVPLARYVAQYGNELNFPYRRYQIGKVFRGERPQKGRYREFYQCDIDIIGEGVLSLVNDAEIPSVIYSVFKRMNLGEFVIKINNRKILNGFIESLGFGEKIDEVLRIVDKLDKIGMDGVRGELDNLGMDKSGVVGLLKFVTIEGNNKEIIRELREIDAQSVDFLSGVDDLEEVVRQAELFGVPEENLKIDLSIARGLGYYTGTVYETVMKNEAVKGSVCSGGRYDNLAENFSEKKYPGVGISIGLTRLFSQLKTAGLIKSQRSTKSEVLVIPMESPRMNYSLKVAAELRDGGVLTEIYTEEGKLKKKFAYADKVGVPYVVTIGEDEENRNTVSLKNMQTGEQERVRFEELKERLKKG